jgi:hypothetical protein
MGLVLALGGSAPAARASPGLETVIQDDAALLHPGAPRVRATMRQLRALGFDRVRLTATWSSLTRSPGSRHRPSFDAANPAAYEQDRWRRLDTAVRSARAAGLRVMIDVGFWAPRWAAHGAGPRVRARIDPAAFADFAVAIARRYSGSFWPRAPSASPAPTPPPPPPAATPPLIPGLPAARAAATASAALPSIDMLALWNEPNHPAFLLPQWRRSHGRPVPASPGVYRAMVRAAYPAIKHARPEVSVLVGNTSSRGGLNGHGPVAPLRFLRQLACVDEHLRPLRDGGCAHFTTLPGDGWAHHPYSLTSPPNATSSGIRSDDIYLGNLPRLAHTLDRLAAKHRITAGMRSIYLTEFGYETRPLSKRHNVTESVQARYLTWGEYLASRVPTVRMFGQFLLRDLPPAATVQSDSPQRPYGQFYTGLQHADGTAKPACRSFRAGLFAQRIGAGRVLLFGRLRLGPAPRRIVVQASSDGRRWVTLSTARASGANTRAFSSEGDGSFVRFAPDRRPMLYRLRVSGPRGHWTPSLPVTAV